MADAQSAINKSFDILRDNPLYPLEIKRIFEKLKSPEASVADFENYYGRDPILCAQLIDLAWEKTAKKATHPFAADHAMSTVGIEGARQVIEKLPELEDVKLTDVVRFQLTASLLAAELAAQLCISKQKRNPLYWASLAHNYPDTLLWHINPKVMWRIAYRQLKLPKKIGLFEQTKLAFELSDWRKAVAEKWHMGELNHTTFSKPQPDKPKELLIFAHEGYSNKTQSLKEWVRTDSWLILVSNWLAKSLLLPWLVNARTHYTKIAAQAFGLNQIKTRTGIVNAVRKTSDTLYDSRLFVPAMLFAAQRTEPAYPEWLNAAPKIPDQLNPTFVKTAQQLKASSRELELKKRVLKLKKSPEQFKNTAELIQYALKACIDVIGYSRASFILINRKNKTAITRLALAKEKQSPIKPDFKLSSLNPLTQFTQKQASYLFESKKQGKLWHKLPSSIVGQKVTSFALFSLKPGEQVKAIIYVDEHPSRETEERKYKLFKLFMSSVNNLLLERGQKSIAPVISAQKKS